MKKQTKPGDMFNKFQKKKKNWIAGAIKHPGALHRELGVKVGHKIPAGKLASAAKKGGKEGKRARLAETLKSFHKGNKKHKIKKKLGPSYHTQAQAYIQDMKSHGLGVKADNGVLQGYFKNKKGKKHKFTKKNDNDADDMKTTKKKMMCKKHKKMNCKDCAK